MRIVFWGTAKFALPSLDRLVLSRHKIVLVVTGPDKKQGRHLKLGASPVKVRAEQLGLSLAQPEELYTDDFINYLKTLSADLFVVVSYGKILKKNILEIPSLYCINLHASLLPKYRGAAPINWAILNGESETGVTVIKMNEQMDAGDILRQRKIDILKEDTSISLEEKLSFEGGKLLMETIDLIEKGKISLIPQDESLSSFAPLLKKENGRIFWQSPALNIHNQVRALQPWPGTYCFLEKTILKLFKTKVLVSETQDEPGKIICLTKDGMVVACGKESLLIEELQLAGGRRMRAREFLLGHHLNVGDFLK